MAERRGGGRLMRVPGDKSISHRALLLSTLSTGGSRLSGLLPGADCQATAAALRALGVEVPPLPPDAGPLPVTGVGLSELRTAPGTLLDCGNSGTTARLLLGLLAGAGQEAVLTGDASLRSRPMRRITDPLTGAGARFVEEGEADRLPVRVAGRVDRPIVHESPVSSAQVKSALLLAGLGAGMPVTVVEPTRSRDHTERMLRRIGVQVDEAWRPDGRWEVRLPATDAAAIRPLTLEVPGDFSSAVFFIALALLDGTAGDGPLMIEGVGVNPTRTGLLPVLERMGAEIRVDHLHDPGDLADEPTANLRVSSGELAGTEVGPEELPLLIDEVPILAVLGARARGRTVIRGAEELRVKESDRIHALVQNLRRLGVEVEEFADGLAVTGSSAPLRGRVDPFHDHRIAMAFGVLAALPGNAVAIDDPDVVEVSYPGFWEVLRGVSRVSGERLPAPPSRRRRSAPVVTLDGPAGSGKSSTARAVADALGFRHLDSGALYRAVTLALIRSDRSPDRWEEVSEAELDAMEIRLVPSPDGFRVLVGGREVEEALRGPEVTAAVSRVARIPAVREWLLDAQRSLGDTGGLVVDGRDTGSVVFPDAEVKIFLTASLEERARRRILQGGEDPDPDRIREECERLSARDRQDENRTLAPLRRPEGAIDLDTTGLSFGEQVERIVEIVRETSAAD